MRTTVAFAIFVAVAGYLLVAEELYASHRRTRTTTELPSAPSP